MTEEIIFGTLMETRLTPQKSMMQLLPFILQVWKVTEVTEAEGLQEEKEDLIQDMDQVEEQIGEQKEDIAEDKDSIEDQEEDRTEDMDLAEEEEEEHNMVPETKVKRGIAWCAKSEDTIAYFTAPSYQNIFPEVIMSNLFPKNYVNSASQLLVTSRIVLYLPS